MSLKYEPSSEPLSLAGCRHPLLPEGKWDGGYTTVGGGDIPSTYTLNPIPSTLYPKSYTLNSKPSTLNRIL